MHHVVQLRLDEATERRIAEAQHALFGQKASATAWPHVTLVSSEPMPLHVCAQQLDALANTVSCLEVTFSYLGVFGGQPQVLFLGVTHTETLARLHRRVFDLVSAFVNVARFTKPDVCVMHCTLGYSAQPDQLEHTRRMIDDGRLPGMAMVRSLDVVEYGPGATLIHSSRCRGNGVEPTSSGDVATRAAPEK